MLSRVFGMRLKLDKDYEVEVLKEMVQSAKSVPIIWTAIVVGFIVFTIAMTILKREEGLYITSIVCALSSVIILSSNVLYSLNRPVEVNNVNALIEAVEVGDYKGIHFLRNAESAKVVQEDILYLTEESISKKEYDNVIGRQDADENGNMIAVKQQVGMFKKNAIYQAALMNEGSTDEYMLLISLDDSKTTIKLEDYTFLENQKYYLVKQIEETFVLLKEENLQKTP